MPLPHPFRRPLAGRPALLLTLAVVALPGWLIGGLAVWAVRPPTLTPPVTPAAPPPVRVSVRLPPPVATTPAAPMPAAAPAPTTTPVRAATRTAATPRTPRAPEAGIPEQKVPMVSAESGESAPKMIAVSLALPDRGDDTTPPPGAEPPVGEPADLVAAASPKTRPAATPATDAGAATWPVRLPGATRLRYAVTGKTKGTTYTAHSELLWQPASDRYDLRLEVKLFLLGSRSETSRGALGARGLEPQRFGAKARSEQATHFDRERGRIVFSSNAPVAPLLPGAQDRLSVILQLSGLLAANPGRFKPGQAVALPVAGPRESEVWRFEVVGRENLLLQSGAQPVIHLVRAPRHPYDQKLELWYAESVNYLPLRIKWTQAQGDFVDQIWEHSETP